MTFTLRRKEHIYKKLLSRTKCQLLLSQNQKQENKFEVFDYLWCCPKVLHLKEATLSNCRIIYSWIKSVSGHLRTKTPRLENHRNPWWMNDEVMGNDTTWSLSLKLCVSMWISNFFHVWTDVETAIPSQLSPGHIWTIIRICDHLFSYVGAMWVNNEKLIINLFALYFISISHVSNVCHHCSVSSSWNHPLSLFCMRGKRGMSAGSKNTVNVPVLWQINWIIVAFSQD